MRRFHLTTALALALVLLPAVSGCAAVRSPQTALAHLLAQPEVARWYAAHSAPAVTQSMSPKDARRWRRYHPAATVDLVKEGLLIKLHAHFGPEPRQVEVLVDRTTGALISEWPAGPDQRP